MPTIDLYSLNYPDNVRDILKWGEEVSGFLRSFGITIDNFSRSRTTSLSQYILCEEDGIKYPNYILLANNHLFKSEKEFIDLMDPDMPFGILAISRLSNINKNILGDLNKVISSEIQNLEKNELVDVLENRKKISKKIYYFKRFKIEFEQIPHIQSLDFGFNSLALNKEDQYNLFDNLLNVIKKQTNEIDDAIDTLNQHSNIILNLKNIEYSKKMQYSIRWLSIIAAILTAFVVILTLFQLLNELIFKIV